MVVGVHHQAARVGRRLVLMDVSPRLDRLLRSSRLGRVLVREYPTVALRVVPASV